MRQQFGAFFGTQHEMKQVVSCLCHDESTLPKMGHRFPLLPKTTGTIQSPNQLLHHGPVVPYTVLHSQFLPHRLIVPAVRHSPPPGTAPLLEHPFHHLVNLLHVPVPYWYFIEVHQQDLEEMVDIDFHVSIKK